MNDANLLGRRLSSLAPLREASRLQDISGRERESVMAATHGGDSHLKHLMFREKGNVSLTKRD